eukprot:1338559-Ditylum_brightwellii.AAC.1
MERQAHFDKHEGATGQMDTGYFDDTRNIPYMSHSEEMRVISLLSHDSVSLRSSDHVRPTVPKEARQPENTGE